jgi:hypothetical protein
MKSFPCILAFVLTTGSFAQISTPAPPQLGNQVAYTFSKAVIALPFYGLGNRTEVLDGAAPSAALQSELNAGNLTGYFPRTRPLGASLALQLSLLPLPTPASGVIYKEDPVTGAMLPSSQSLGPILTERAETIGKGRFFMGQSRQQFRFSQLDGKPLNNLTLLYPGGEPTQVTQNGVLQTTSPATIGAGIDIRLSQNVTSLTYGLTNRFDISAGLSWINASMSVLARDARLFNNGDPARGGTCWCAQTFNPRASLTDTANFGTAGFTVPGVFGRASSSSSGIGDTLLRFKGVVTENRNFTLAAGSEFRLPTGDALNLRGSGAFGAKPFLAISLAPARFRSFSIAPQFSTGYQLNGSSILAGDIVANRKAGLPSQLHWSAGATIGMHSRFSYVVDFIGIRMSAIDRIVDASVPGRGQGVPAAFGSVISPVPQALHMNSASVGFKWKVAGNIILTGNMLAALDSNGMRDKIVPMLSVGYAF